MPMHGASSGPAEDTRDQHPGRRHGNQDDGELKGLERDRRVCGLEEAARPGCGCKGAVFPLAGCMSRV
jgi:hypothetical protein